MSLGSSIGHEMPRMARPPVDEGFSELAHNDKTPSRRRAFDRVFCRADRI